MLIRLRDSRASGKEGGDGDEEGAMEPLMEDGKRVRLCNEKRPDAKRSEGVSDIMAGR